MVFLFNLKVTGIDFEIKNIKELRKNLPKIKDNAMQDFMNRFLLKAQALAPVKTGALRDSLHIGKEANGKWFLADGVYYGIFQENGFVSKDGSFHQHSFVIPAFHSTYPPVYRF